MPVMDTCVYCGVEYHPIHPMPRWYKRGSDEVVTVCYKLKCEEQAKEAGFRRPRIFRSRKS